MPGQELLVPAGGNHSRRRVSFSHLASWKVEQEMPEPDSFAIQRRREIHLRKCLEGIREKISVLSLHSNIVFCLVRFPADPLKARKPRQ